MVDSSSPYLGALGTIAKTRWQERHKFAYLATKTVLLQRHFCTLYTCNFHFNLHISQPFSPHQLLVETDFCISAEAVSTQQQGFLIYFFFFNLFFLWPNLTLFNSSSGKFTENLQSKRLGIIQLHDYRNFNFGCVLADFVVAKVPDCPFSFLTFFAVLPCEYFLASTKVAVCCVKSNTLAFVLTRQIATWRLQKRKQNRSH